MHIEGENNYLKEWEKSYSQGDNNILYPQSEVIRFLNRFIRKRNNDGTFSALIKKDADQVINGLDFACGVGTHCITFKDFNIEGYGVDISKTAINIAKKRSRLIGLDDNRFKALDPNSQKLHFNDNFFDFVVAESCLDSMPFTTAQSYIHELKRVTDGLIYASFIGHNDSINSDEFVVSTKLEKGTIQSVYDEEKICKLFGVEAQELKYFNKTVQFDAISNSIIDCRYYCVFSNTKNL